MVGVLLPVVLHTLATLAGVRLDPMNVGGRSQHGAISRKGQ